MKWSTNTHLLAFYQAFNVRTPNDFFLRWSWDIFWLTLQVMIGAYMLLHHQLWAGLLAGSLTHTQLKWCADFSHSACIGIVMALTHFALILCTVCKMLVNWINWFTARFSLSRSPRIGVINYFILKSEAALCWFTFTCLVSTFMLSKLLWTL